MAGSDFSHAPGDEFEVRNDIAEAWEGAGIAKIVEDEPKTLKPKKKKLDSDE